jgi:uracil-DNA glycosylase family 4
MDDWLFLERDIVACRACPRLAAWCAQVARVRRRAYRDEIYWGQPVPGFGDRAARVWIVGLAPGAHGANRTGRIFTGDSSGDFLYAALYRAGFANQPTSRDRADGLALCDAYISLAGRCAPPDNRPTPAELAACQPFLAREAALLTQGTVVVALGRIAFDALLHLYDVGPAGPFAHGAIYPLGAGQPTLIASYHPSRQNTQTGRLTPVMFDAVWAAARGLLSPGSRT